jgi:hypothetical protein
MRYLPYPIIEVKSPDELDCDDGELESDDEEIDSDDEERDLETEGEKEFGIQPFAENFFTYRGIADHPAEFYWPYVTEKVTEISSALYKLASCLDPRDDSEELGLFALRTIKGIKEVIDRQIETAEAYAAQPDSEKYDFAWPWPVIDQD